MAARRAPRLRPDQLLAPYVTRTGRFAEHDPSEGRPLPGVAEMLGALAWAGFVVGTLRRARRAARLAPGDPG